MKRIMAANRVFLLSVFGTDILLIILMLMNVGDIYVLQFLTEVFMVLPALLYVGCIRKKSIPGYVGMKKLRFKTILVLCLEAFCVTQISTFVNILSQLVFPNNISGSVGEMIAGKPFLIILLIVAIEPALCEEYVFRGVLYQGYRKNGIWTAAIVSAACFSLMHMDFNQMSYAFVIGIVFALTNEAVGTISASMVIHFLFNAVSVVEMYAVKFIGKYMRTIFMNAREEGKTNIISNITDQLGLTEQELESEQWFEIFISKTGENVSMKQLLPKAAFWCVLGIVGCFWCIYYLAKDAGRLEYLKSALFRRKKITEENLTTFATENDVVNRFEEKKAQQKVGFSFLTPALVITACICLLISILNFTENAKTAAVCTGVSFVFCVIYTLVWLLIYLPKIQRNEWD